MRTQVLLDRALAALSLFTQRPRSVVARARWRCFSLTSYRMIDDLRRQGVLPKTVIDVGANIGQFAYASARLFDGVRVHSFEPVPDALTELRSNVRGLENVVIHECALGEQRGEASITVNEHVHASSFLPLTKTHEAYFPEARPQRSVTVPVETLDSVFGDVMLPGPVLLKIDVQGFEPYVLRGGRKTLARVDYVLMEASFRPMYEGELTFLDLVGEMHRYGFDFVRPVGWFARPETGEFVQCDALFANRASAAAIAQKK